MPTLTRAAAFAVGDDAAEVPEAGLAAVAFQAPHAWLAGALPRCGVAGSPVGAIGVALAGAWEPERKREREAESRPRRRGDAGGCIGAEGPTVEPASCSAGAGTWSHAGQEVSPAGLNNSPLP